MGKRITALNFGTPLKAALQVAAAAKSQRAGEASIASAVHARVRMSSCRVAASLARCHAYASLSMPVAASGAMRF